MVVGCFLSRLLVSGMTVSSSRALTNLPFVPRFQGFSFIPTTPQQTFHSQAPVGKLWVLSLKLLHSSPPSRYTTRQEVNSGPR